MSKQYYDSALTGAEIDKALKAVSDLVTQNNNGKILTIENGKFAAKKPSEIAGTAVLEALNVSANGDYYPGSGVDGYDEVHVSVPSYPEPTGTIQISSNGTVNVKDYASAEVSVPSGITAADEGKVVKNGALVAQTARATAITENGTYDTTENNSVTVNVSGGGSPVIPHAIRLTPYSEDNNSGYIGGGEWYAYGLDHANCRTDMYELDPEDGSTRYFLIFVASGGGNRFRVALFGVDPTSLPSGVQQTISGSYPLYHPPTNSPNESNRGAFTGGLYQVTNITTKKYLCIGKTNENIDGIKSYVIDITGAP